MLEIFIGKSKNRMQLQDTDFLASGGQANVYAKRGLVYKIYHDPKTLIPEQKLNELSGLKNHPEIVLPIDQIYDHQGERIGLVFRWIQNAEPLYNMGSNGYWRDHGITPQIAAKIIDSIKRTAELVHKHSCLVVDFNPFNVLVNQDTFETHFFIDTESWQTKSFPATAIMPSIRDYHSKDFSDLTDWYSFAIISCEFFLGIHPFKGNHPRFNNSSGMEERMKVNASLFDKNVKINSRVRPLDTIPGNYRQWYIDLFQAGKRIKPPDNPGDSGMVTAIKQTAIVTTGLKVELLQEYDSRIAFHQFINGTRIVKTESGVWVKKELFNYAQVDVLCVDKDFLFVKNRVKDNLNFYNERNRHFQFDYQFDYLMVSDNQLYLKDREYLYKIDVSGLGDNYITAHSQTWQIMPNSTQVYPGLCIQNILGKVFFLFPGYSNIQIPELEGYRIILAKRWGNVVAAIANKDGQDCRFIFTFNWLFDAYHTDREETDDKDLNMAVLVKKEIAIILEQDGQIEIMSLRGFNRKTVKDDEIKADWILSNEDERVVFYSDNKLFSVSMK